MLLLDKRAKAWYNIVNQREETEMEMMRYTDGQGEIVEHEASGAMKVWCLDRDIKWETFEQEPPQKVVIYNVVSGKYMLSTLGTPDHEKRISKYWEVTNITPEDFLNNYWED